MQVKRILIITFLALGLLEGCPSNQQAKIPSSPPTVTEPTKLQSPLTAPPTTHPASISINELAQSRQPKIGEGCDCPYDRNALDRTCGRASAYFKKGGKEPMCFIGDKPGKLIRDNPKYKNQF